MTSLRSRRSKSTRRLKTETLEDRLCLSAVRVVAWNTANSPNNASEDALYSTVFEAIGNENVAGNALPPSIIALQETDTAAFGGNSILRIENILESLYPSTNYAHAASPLDTGDDSNGFVYDTGIFDLVSTSVVDETPGMQSFAHNILRGQFRPDGTSGESDFYIYTTHLKAGSSGTDENRRTAEANAIRVDIDALGEGQDVLVMGDFNIGGSSEGAYQNFLAPGNGQLFDPIDTPGEWKNNFSFRSVHTQNPAINGPGGMDDRFDFQIGTAEVFDDEGLQYIEGSYRAFGNNNTHTFNSDITTGTGASPNVLAALAGASDHLPVVVDYEIGVFQPGVTITPTGGNNAVTEGGNSDTYTVVLDSVPTSDVTVTITTDGQTLVSGSTTTSIVFTPGNALTPKSLMLTAVDDAIVEGTHLSEITHAISSADPTFSSLANQIIDVTVSDNDGGGGTPSIVISEIMYNPASSETDGLSEWIEVANLGSSPVDISGWFLDDEDTTDWGAIPANTPVLVQGDIAVIHNQQITSADFRSAWNVPASVQVIGVAWGSLSNSPSGSSEVLQLLDATAGEQDLVNYDDTGDWPTDNGRSSIYLTDLTSDNNVGTNWALSVSGVDDATNPTGNTFNNDDIGSPGFAPIPILLSPPNVVETRFDESGTAQRSMVRSVTVVFDQVVTAPEAAFEVVARDLDPAAAAVGISLSLATVDTHSEATLTFSGPNVDALTNSLLDGNYLLTIQSEMVTSVLTGQKLDGDNNGAAGGNAVIGDSEADAFFRFFGDMDGDRDVDPRDLTQFAPTFLQAAGQAGFNDLLDSDGDDDVDSRDYSQLGLRLLKSLPF